MKRWHKRSIFILIAGIIGMGALSVRTAIEPDRQVTRTANPICCAIPPTAQSINVSDCWQPFGENADSELFRSLQPQDIHINIRSEAGKLIAEYDTPILHSVDKMNLVSTQYQASLITCTSRNGSQSATFYLLCTVQIAEPFRKKSNASTLIYTKTIPLVNCPPCDKEATQEASQPISAEQTTTKKSEAPPPPPQPLSTPKQEALNTLQLELTALAQQADEASIATFIKKAEQAVQHHTNTELPWPDCWDDAAEDAATAATNVQESITAIRNNNYWDSMKLADFIASESFSRIFGSAHRGDNTSFIEDELGTGLEDMIFIHCDEETFDANEEKK